MGLSIRKGIWKNGNINRWWEWISPREIDEQTKVYWEMIKIKDSLPDQEEVLTKIFKTKRNLEFTMY